MASGRQIKSAIDIATTVAVLIAALLVAVDYLRRPSPPSMDVRFEDVSDERIEALAITKRQGTGRVALVEFGDYECPFCARHVRGTHPELSQEFIEPGTLQHVFFNFPLERIHPGAFLAAEAAECAGSQGRFWEMHQRLFGEDAELDEADFLRHADELGLDADGFEACLANGQTAAAVRHDQEEGKRLGVSGTPSFFIGTVEEDGSISLRRRITGSAPIELFRQEIAAALEMQRASSQSRRWWWPL